MSFAREGLVFIAIAAFVAAGTYAVALNRRSWPLWLLAFALTIVTLWVAYFFRDPARSAAGGERLVHVHVPRHPAGGNIHHRRSTPGRFLNAGVEKSSFEHEQTMSRIRFELVAR